MVQPQINIAYHADSWLGVRFYDNFRFATKKDIGERSGALAPNWLEITGNTLLWITEEFPKKVWTVLKEPRFVSFALTILALGVVSLGFYPATTVLVIKTGIALLPQIPFWAVKFSAYLLTCGTILGYGLRAQGRFWNSELTNAFWNQARPVVDAPASK